MRIWDINPGYLNRESLLGEHRELHGIVSIITNGKKGYSAHPETIRWKHFGWALRRRHQELVCEMSLRGYRHQSPVRMRSNKGKWPPYFIDAPGRQYQILAAKYSSKVGGRIPLPRNQQELWRNHKYSVLARDPQRYRRLGRQVSNGQIAFEDLALELTQALRKSPSVGGIRNAVEHMWGYIPSERRKKTDVRSLSLRRLLATTQKIAMSEEISYIKSSTALGELMACLSARHD